MVLNLHPVTEDKYFRRLVFEECFFRKSGGTDFSINSSTSINRIQHFFIITFLRNVLKTNS